MVPTPSAGTAEAATRTGMISGAAAYGLWGLLPLYFPLLVPASAWEIAAHRVIWSVIFCVGLLALTGAIGRLRVLLADRRVLGRLAVAAVLLATNWVTFLFAVLTDRVIDAALGYFINPIVTVFLAVLVLRERLRPAQWVAVAIAGAGVVIVGFGYGTVPWIALLLAGSFGVYGLAKNRIGRTVQAIPGLAVEAAVLAPVALGFIGYLAITGGGTFLVSAAADGEPIRFGVAAHTLLLIGSGLAAAIPLLLFATAARRLRLATIGMLQFIAPILQFLLGVLVLGEQMPPTRWAGFVLVWVALVVLSVEGYRARRRNPTLPSPGGATGPA